MDLSVKEKENGHLVKSIGTLNNKIKVVEADHIILSQKLKVMEEVAGHIGCNTSTVYMFLSTQDRNDILYKMSLVFDASKKVQFISV